MPKESPDPLTIDVLVVHAGDVVAALAATAQGRETVLRVTPPFRRRQRARIHVPSDGAATSAGDVAVPGDACGDVAVPGDSHGDVAMPDDARGDVAVPGDSYGDVDGLPLLVAAAAFVDDDAPAFPRAPDTEPAPAGSSTYDVDEHYDRHADAVADWRDRISEHFRDVVAVAGPGCEDCEFEVRYLGV